MTTTVDVEAVELQRISTDHSDCGVSITWEDLYVTAPDRNLGRRAILQGLNGYARPSEVLAIMGPSGCGKSTLLDTLAGRLGSDIRQKGKVLINGRRQTLAFGTSAYVTQDDILISTLTVREAIFYSAQLQLPDTMALDEKKKRAEETIEEMGLADASDTRIGGWGVKGLSGGQKRRVSICIEILTRPKLLFLDEPTSGLDSAASYHVMSRIIRLAKNEAMTVLASIHQPSSETFNLFHSLCLLAYGKTVYFGPPPMTAQFFAINGFECPLHINPSDHYLKTINKDFDKYSSGEEEKQKEEQEENESKRLSVAEVIDILTLAYNNSIARSDVGHQMSEICKSNSNGDLVKKREQAGFMNQTLVLTKRSFVNMYRDWGYYWLRFAIYIALCLCCGTIFYKIGDGKDSIQGRGAMLMFTSTFLTFMAIGGFPSFVEDMKIFGRERLNGHYEVSSFVIANTVSSAPYLVLISIIPGAIVYYLVGLQSSIDHFIYFALVLYACMMIVEGLMMIVASLVPSYLMGIITGAGIQGVMMLNGGFFRLPNDLPNPVWKYPMFYIAFHRYANQGMFKNEFLGLSLPNGADAEDGYFILKNFWQVNVSYSKWVDLGVLVAMVFVYRLLFLLIVNSTEKMKPVLAFIVNLYNKPSPKSTPIASSTI